MVHSRKTVLAICIGFLIYAHAPMASAGKTATEICTAAYIKAATRSIKGLRKYSRRVCLGRSSLEKQARNLAINALKATQIANAAHDAVDCNAHGDPDIGTNYPVVFAGIMESDAQEFLAIMTEDCDGVVTD